MAVDNEPVDLGRAVKLKPGTGRVQFRYTELYLSAPDRIRYAYKLEGLDSDWIYAGGRRLVNYNSLPHGKYRFVVRGMLPGQSSDETLFRV